MPARVFGCLDMLAKVYRKNYHELSTEIYHWNGDSMSNENTLRELKKMWNDCIDFLASLQRKYHCADSHYEKHLTGQLGDFRYTDLVAARIVMAVDAYYTAIETPK